MRHLNSEEKQQILKRYREGVPLRQIGREMGRPDITIRRTLEALGVDFGPPRTTNKRSSPETEAKVVALYDEGRTWADIMSETGVSDVTVAKILRRNDREPARKPEGTAGKEELISALYETGHSAREIGHKLHHSKTTIVRVVKDGGGAIRVPPSCEFPEYFESIDTPEKAYWLGFITADGCVTTTAARPDGSHLSVKLAIGDRDHLVKLKSALGAPGGVHTGVQRSFNKVHGYAELFVYSRRLTDSLLALGIQPRKSATVQPWNGPADLVPHYWRGVFDGDGSIARKGDGLWTLFLCGSEGCVRAFAEWARGISGTTAKPYFRSGCWYVSISGRRQVSKLLGVLYGGASVALDRKKVLADSVTGSRE